MGIELPADLPSWLGWILFVVTAAWWLLSSVSKLRSESRVRAKSDIETLQLKLEMLREQGNAYREQLSSMSDALLADAHGAPTDAEIDAVASIGEAGNPGYVSMARHLRARADARRLLPQVLEHLARVQDRQVQLSSEIGLGVVVDGESVRDLRTELDRVGGDVLRLIRELSDSPRIIVGEGPPVDGEGDEGDIYLQLPHDALSEGPQATER